MSIIKRRRIAYGTKSLAKTRKSLPGKTDEEVKSRASGCTNRIEGILLPFIELKSNTDQEECRNILEHRGSKQTAHSIYHVLWVKG